MPKRGWSNLACGRRESARFNLSWYAHHKGERSRRRGASRPLLRLRKARAAETRPTRHADDPDKRSRTSHNHPSGAQSVDTHRHGLVSIGLTACRCFAWIDTCRHGLGGIGLTACRHFRGFRRRYSTSYRIMYSMLTSLWATVWIRASDKRRPRGDLDEHAVDAELRGDPAERSIE
jgi:hypothetical protein